MKLLPNWLSVAPLAFRQVDHHARGLDRGHGLHAWLEAELIGGFARDEGEDAVRARLDLDGGGEAVALDLGDDAGEPVAGAGGSDGFVTSAFGEQARDLRGRDGALAAGRAVDTELAVAFPAAEGFDADAEGLGRFADAIAVGSAHGEEATPPR